MTSGKIEKSTIFLFFVDKPFFIDKIILKNNLMITRRLYEIKIYRCDEEKDRRGTPITIHLKSWRKPFQSTLIFSTACVRIKKWAILLQMKLNADIMRIEVILLTWWQEKSCRLFAL